SGCAPPSTTTPRVAASASPAGEASRRPFLAAGEPVSAAHRRGGELLSRPMFARAVGLDEGAVLV
ncbi:MAG: hypothetical protein ACREBE_21495, partial [bacterium]